MPIAALVAIMQRRPADSTSLGLLPLSSRLGSHARRGTPLTAGVVRLQAYLQPEDTSSIMLSGEIKIER